MCSCAVAKDYEVWPLPATVVTMGTRSLRTEHVARTHKYALTGIQVEVLLETKTLARHEFFAFYFWSRTNMENNKLVGFTACVHCADTCIVQTVPR